MIKVCGNIIMSNYFEIDVSITKEEWDELSYTERQDLIAENIDMEYFSYPEVEEFDVHYVEKMSE